jgi:hypothetical protein
MAPTAAKTERLRIDRSFEMKPLDEGMPSP